MMAREYPAAPCAPRRAYSGALSELVAWLDLAVPDQPSSAQHTRAALVYSSQPPTHVELRANWVCAWERVSCRHLRYTMGKHDRPSPRARASAMLLPMHSSIGISYRLRGARSSVCAESARQASSSTANTESHSHRLLPELLLVRVAVRAENACCAIRTA